MRRLVAAACLVLAIAPPRASADAAQGLLDRATDEIARAKYTQGAASAAEAVALLEATLGHDDPRVASALVVQGTALRQAGSLAEAKPVLERALAIREKHLPAGDPAVADALDATAILLLKTGDYPRAKALSERALAIWEKASGPDHPDVARGASTLGQILVATAPKEARPHFERALAITEAKLGPADRLLVERLNNLAEIEMLEGAPSKAAALVGRSLTIAETSMGPDHPEVGGILHNLGMLAGFGGDDAQAIAHYRRALGILETSLGPKHPDVAGCLRNLGSTLERTGRYTEAKPYLERSLAITEELVGSDHRDVAFSLNGLAILHQHMGSYAAAKDLLDRSVGISERLFGGEHPDVATQMHNKALVLRDMGYLAEARAAEERALAIREKLFGQEHALVASSLLGLGAILVDLGAYPEARAALTRAAAIDATLLASCSTQLARAAEGTGALEEAKALHERAIALESAQLGPDHPVVARVTARLGRVLLAMGDLDGALRLSLESERSSREQLRVLTAALPERQALDYASARPMGLDQAITIAMRRADDAAAVASVWEEVVRSRGLVLDEVAARHRGVADTPEAKDLATARARMAKLFVRGPGRGTPEEFRRALDDARKKKESAEEALARKSASHGALLSRARLGLDGVRAALPRDAAIVSFSRYADFPAPREAGAPIPAPKPAYAAFALCGASGSPSAVPLGSAEEIDGLVARWREEAGKRVAPKGRLAKQAERSYDAAATALRERVWDPVRERCKDASTVFLVPDGALNLVSFAALVDAESRYLIESGPLVHYLATERDLAAGEAPAEGSGLLAIGGPSFDDRPGTTTVAATYRGERSLCSAFRDARFERLPGATVETREVTSLWESSVPGSDAVGLTGAAATEAALKTGAPGRRALHLATHGFFLDGTCAAGAARPGIEDPSRILGENPLLLSGLAFAGANRRDTAQPSGEDGILTAEEIAALDLSSVEWAVLSACDTGVGRVRPGEGVFGLRRGFQIAGARTLIMSLWPVDDVASRAWMRALYEARFTRGLPTHEAVRDAGRSVLKARRAAGETDHPSAWAAFVAAGDWR